MVGHGTSGNDAAPAGTRRCAGRRHGAGVLAGLVLLVLSAPLLAGEVTVRNARIDWTPGQLPNRAFFELVNGTDETLALVGARSPQFAHVRFKAAPDNDLFMLESLEMPQVIGPGETLAFHPEGAYLFLYVKSRWMEPADTATIELLFADREPLAVEFTVRK